jgi:HAD superfamily hydrolase (TIGR01549 family)
MNRKYIVFDFDGVLVDSLDHNLEAAAAACRAVGHERVPTRQDIEAMENMVFGELLHIIGMDPERIDEAVRLTFAELSRDSGPLPFFPGIPEAVRCLSAVHAMAVLTTNMPELVRTQLAHAGLGECFDRIMGADLPGSKGDKLRMLSRELGLSAGDVVMVGDAVSDVRHARSAGVRAVAVSWGFQSRDRLLAEGPDLMVDEPGQLCSLL